MERSVEEMVAWNHVLREGRVTPASCTASPRAPWAPFCGAEGGLQALGPKAELDGTNSPDEHVSSTLQHYHCSLLSVESCYDSHYGFK